MVRDFLRRSFWFILPIAVLAWPLDRALSALLLRSSACEGEFEVWNDIRSGRASCDIAIYGSSRAWVQIDPEILEEQLGGSAYNFGIDGQNFWLQHLRHEQIKRYCDEAKWIILSVDVDGLVGQTDLYNSDQFLPYMLWDRAFRHYLSPYSGFTWGDHWLPLVRYFGRNEARLAILKTFFGWHDQQPYRNKGFRGVDRSWNRDLSRARDSLGTLAVTIDPSMLMLFEHFIQECSSSGIGLVLVDPPQYVEGQSLYQGRAAVMEIYKGLARKYGLHYLDYSHDTIATVQAFYYNSNHLNRKGSEVFSQKLGHDLRPILEGSLGRHITQ